MAKVKGKKRQKQNRVVEQYLGPTPERMVANDFESAGPAKRVVPVIETLLKQKRISRREFDALAHYRDQAHRAEDDLAQESTLSPERIMGGGGSSFGSKIPVGVLLATPAIIETTRIERELGSLLDVTRAVAVDDVSLTQWAIKTSGGREFTRKDKVTEIVPVDPMAVGYALLELRFAAGRFGK